MNTTPRRAKSDNWKIRLYDSDEKVDHEVMLEGEMPAYVVVDLDIVDEKTFEAYKQMVPATIEQYGGRYIVRGGKMEVLEGTWSPRRLVIVEFPSMDKAKAWSDSLEYAKPKALRQACARSQIVLIEGV